MRNKVTLIGLGVVTGILLATAGIAWAGSLDPAAGPHESGSQMFTLQQIYDRLVSGAEGTKMTGFTEPGSGPGVSTMPTLDEIMAQAPALDAAQGAGVADVAAGKTFWGLTAGGWGLRTGTRSGVGEGIGVPKTGQQESDATGDDGDLQVGVNWPFPRFTDNEDGTVTDNLTGLIWLQWADCFGAQAWEDALISANTLASGACELVDGSAAGEWRLPNVREQQSLIDYGRTHTALPMDHPFTLALGYPSRSYWTSTTVADDNTLRAWYVGLYNGLVQPDLKTVDADHHVWPVKGAP
jgi:hypothetical protein